VEVEAVDQVEPPHLASTAAAVQVVRMVAVRGLAVGLIVTLITAVWVMEILEASGLFVSCGPETLVPFPQLVLEVHNEIIY